MTGPLLSVILVYHNDRRNLGPCLESIGRISPDLPRETILVDNASTDGGAEEAAAAFPAARIIRNEGNPGFGAANNRAAGESSGEFLLFLNTDTVLQPGAVEALLAALRADAGAAAAGPLLFPGDGKIQVSFGRRVDFSGQLIQKLFLNPFHRRTINPRSRTRRVGWLSAACLLCRREAFAAAGGFDERFFLYFEDIDLCLRLRKAGGRLLYVPAARVFHAGGASTGVRPEASRLAYRESQLRFYRKHASSGSLRLLRGYLRILLGIQRVFGRFRGQEGRRRRASVRAMLDGKGDRP